MNSANFIIHIIALIPILGLIISHAYLREQKNFILKLLSLKNKSKYYELTTPMTLTQKIAKCFEIKLNCLCKDDLSLKKIRIDRFFHCFISFEVTNLSYEANLSNVHILTIFLSKDIDLSEYNSVAQRKYQQELSEDLGIKVLIITES